MKLAAAAASLALVAVAAAPAHAEDEHKDPTTAFLLSLGGTAGSVALIVAGGNSDNSGMMTAGLLSSLVTPAFGHYYAGEYLTWGTGIRLGGGALFLVGVGQALGCLDQCETGGNTEALLATGAVLYVGGALIDIATAPSAANSWNAKHQLQVAPTMVSTGASTTMGLGVGGTF